MRKHLTLVVTAVVLAAAVTAVVTELLGATVGRTGRDTVLRVALYGVGAVGVIWLSWRWIRLTGAVTSIAKHLRTDRITELKPSGIALIDELGEAVDMCIASSVESAEQLGRQVKDLQIKAQLSHQEKAKAEAIIYSLRDAVMVVDEFDRLVMANEAAARLFGFDHAGAQSKTLDELIDSVNAQFTDFLRHSRSNKVEATRREVDFAEEGKVRTFDCIVSCVNDERDQVCGVVVVLHDITREREVSQMKNDFVSHVSHELKTPLASITAYSEMLVDGEADDEETRREFYTVIQNQAERLNRLIEDILNISRIESGLIKVNKEPVSVTILIAEQLQMIHGYAEEKNITVSSPEPIIYDQVLADRDMISQVIVNLLSNAVKYTPAGGSVTIETQVDDSAGLVRVHVTDTGVGIPAGEIEHVFDKFYRVGANKKQAKGTGLGLNLVKQIVETVHQGRVFVTSKVGQGSTFGFELPLATTETLEAAQHVEAQRVHHGCEMKL